MSDIDAVEKALKKAKLPKWVGGTRVEAMIDHTGEPAVRITIIVKAGDEKIAKDGAAVSALAQQVRAVVDAAGVHLFPYTRFVGANELAA